MPYVLEIGNNGLIFYIKFDCVKSIALISFLNLVNVNAVNQKAI